MTVEQAALRLGVSQRRVRAMIHAGQLSGEQVYPRGPWVIQGPLKLQKNGRCWDVAPVKKEKPETCQAS